MAAPANRRAGPGLTQVNAIAAPRAMLDGETRPSNPQPRRHATMAYKDLLVHLDATKACAKRIDAAIALAVAHDAHLTALCPVVTPSLPGYVAVNLPPEIIENQRQMIERQAETVAQGFRDKVARSDVRSDVRLEHCLDIDVAFTIGVHARYADLVILGQSDPQEPPLGGRAPVEDIVLHSGRPALVVPYIGAGKTLGRNITVAWDAGREAARTVSDAMPLLEQADTVTVMVVNPRPGPDLHGPDPGTDIARHLARHGVNTEVYRTEAPDLSVGDVLLSRLADSGSDLLVMGAYGHARFRELVLGGATRTILEQMTVPVFMSH